MNKHVLDSMKRVRDKRRDWFSLKTDMFDIREFQGICSVSEPISDILHDAADIGATGAPLVQDTFSMLYKPAPVRSKKLAPEFKINDEVIQEIMKTTEYATLHKVTTLDKVGTALGMMSLAPAVLEVYRKYKEEREQAEEARKQAQKEYDESTDTPKQEAAMDKMKNVKKKIKSMKQSMRTKLRKVAAAAEKDVDEGKGALAMLDEGWGDGDGPDVPTGWADKLEAAQKLLQKDDFKKIAYMLGRMRIISQRVQAQKTEYEAGEIVNVGVGRDIARMLPSELSKLRHPILKKDWRRRYVEGSLLQYELKMKLPKGKGPIVVAMDESGSMGGVKNLWAKAVFLALAQLARKQKRALAAIRFSSIDQYEKMVWPTGKMPMRDVIHMVEAFYSGGTDFKKPFVESIEILRSSEFLKGDLVFITDGECDINSSYATELCKVKQEMNFRAVGVLVGEGAFDDQTRRVLDSVVRVRVLGEGGMTPQLDDTDALDTILAV